MAGTALGAGLVLSTATLMLGLATVGAASVESQRMAGVADAAALAAANAATGVVSGPACARAADIAREAGAALDDCILTGKVATVAVADRFLGLPIQAQARAGPPAAKRARPARGAARAGPP